MLAVRNPAPPDAAPAPIRLVGRGVADFGEPVSQGYTPAQLAHADCRLWAARFGLPQATSVSWPAAFVLQVLARYEALSAGAHGLAIDTDDPWVAGTLAQVGCVVGAGSAGSASFDFTWSIGGGRFDAVADRLWRGLHASAPGGMGVHVFTLGEVLTRPDVERLALNVLSFGHAVAELRFDPQMPTPAAFGVVVRRAVEG